jgi:iron(III) transport system substrate-binding protein
MVQKSVLWSAFTMVLVLVIGAGPSFGASALRDKMIAKAKKEKALVAAGSNARELRTKLRGFKKLYPFITVKAVKGNTSNTVNRVVTEAKANRLTIDMVAIDDAGCELLAQRGLLAKYDFPHLANFTKGTQPSHGLYVDLFGNPRVQGVYNKNLVKASEVPKTWDDIVSKKWKGKTLISRSSEEFPARLAYVWRSKSGKLNWDRAFKFFGTLIKNQKPAIARGYSGGNQRVAAGEVAIFWFPAIGNAVRLAVNKNAPVGLIAFPKFPITYRSYAILKGAPNKATAWLMLDYLSSPEGQFDYTSTVSAKSALNMKAKPGKLAKWMIENGATNANGDLSDPTETSKVYTEKVLKKSEDFYFKQLGIR